MKILSPAHAPGALLALGALLFATETTAWSAAQEKAAAPTRIDRRASQCDISSQDSVVLDVDGAGRALVVWQSRRQQEGTYGIYARRYLADGTAIGDEVQVNETTRSHQMHPATALDANGTSWIAWTSYGQDGDRNSVVARRFDAALGTATPEIVVNEITEGDQDQLVIASDAEGRALVVWTSLDRETQARHLFGRRLDPDGTPSGSAFRIDEGSELAGQLPSVALADDGSFVVVWARLDAAGLPLGIFGRQLDADGESIGEEFRVSAKDRPVGLEPSVDVVAPGQFVVTWLEQRDEDYGIAFRRFTTELGFTTEKGGEEPKLKAGETHLVAHGDGGYVSGLTVAARSDGGFALAWNLFENGARHHSDLLLCCFDAEDRPLTRPFPATAARAGHQRISAADGTKKLHYSDGGELVVAWSGNGNLGDQSGAHISWIVPEGVTPAAASEPLEPARTFAAVASVEPGEEPAKPHEPPTFDPNDVGGAPPKDARTFVTGDFGFTGLTSTGWTPPDPHLAAGPEHLVLMANGAIAFYQKDGTLDFQDAIEGSGGFWGSVGAGGFVFDPEVVYDTHSGRFFAMAAEDYGGNYIPYFLLAVSDDSNPNGTWHKYRILVQGAAGGTFIDSPNIAVDSQAVYLTADFFSPDRLLVYVLEKAPLLTGGALNANHMVINGTQSHGIAMTYGTAPAQYMVWSHEGGTSTDIRLVAIENPLTGPTIQTTSIPVPAYTQPENPPQLGTSTRPETFESRFWSCVYRNGYVWATHHVNGSRVRQRWYQIDPGNWPISGTPTLVQSGEIDLGGNIRTFFGSIWADDDDNMALTFSRSSPGEYISMGYAYRTAGDPLGTTQTPVTARDSTSADTSGRWGDYSAITDDPAAPGTFWAHHEYRESSWRTWVHRFDVCESPQSYCTSSPNSVGPGAVIGYGGSNSVSANDLVLSVVAAPPVQFGVFFYGPNQISIPFGDGVRCVGGGIIRLPVLSTSVFGDAAWLLDITNPPYAAGQISAGETWNFQFWYRDPNFGGAGYNTSDGLQVPFCP